MRTPIGFAILGFAFWGTVAAGWAQTPGPSCVSCHDQGQKLSTSAHAALGCTSCHEKHEVYPHPTGVPKPDCAQCHADIAGQHAASVHGQELKRGNAAAPTCGVCHGGAHEVTDTKTEDFHKGVPDLCGMCHTEIAEQYKASVHGQAVARGVAAAPVCTNCHGEHSILSPKSEASSVNPIHIRDTCGQCHGNVRLSRRFGLPSDRIVSFDASFHGLAAKSGSQSVANCSTCHGFHGILPSSDPRSSTNPKNLPATCGRCHPGAGTRFAIGSVHQTEAKGEPAAVRWVRLSYLILIPLTIGYMLLHNLGDWLRKLRELRFRPWRRISQLRAPRPVLRMYGFERIEHALLAISFIVLAWTGFALKYPDQWWAQPLVAWEKYFPVRGTVHRIAAVIFVLTGVMHAGSLAASRRLREHWKELWPRPSDVPETVLGFAYNTHLIARKPEISSHSYIEKMEYWAVVWGGVVMGLTGGLLWANNLTLHWLPKTALDIAISVHMYEAVLATLAIFVWHFYSVIFDPDVYPLETAFLTGYSVKPHEAETEADPQPEASDLAPQDQ
jgi:cytochrome b subunit of formate dehydrogenase